MVDIGSGCVMPGLVEAHGHPLMEAVVLSDRMVDIRPVTVTDADQIVAIVRAEVDKRGDAGAYLVGWDALLQPGLPEPSLAWLDGIAPSTPLVIIHNSGHKPSSTRSPVATSGSTATPRIRREPSTAATKPANSTAPPRRPARCSH